MLKRTEAKIVFFSIIFLTTLTYKTRNITITKYYCMLAVSGKKDKNKLIQSEIKVKLQ